MSLTPHPPIDRALVARVVNLALERIPLAGQLDVRLERLDEHGLTMAAPLAPNRNHMGTGFAGSITSVATLAGWAMVLAITGAPDDVDVVAQTISMEFKRPVTGDFRAVCRPPDDRTLARVHTMLDKRGRSRVELVVDVMQEEQTVATLTGRFALMRATGDG